MTEVVEPAPERRRIPFSKVLRGEGPEALGAALGFGVPIALGLASGHVGAGLAGATGALMASGGGLTQAGPDERGRRGPRSPGLILLALGAPILATFIAQTIAGQGWTTAVLVVLIATIVSLIGGFSRPAAAISIRFNVFLMISLGVEAAARADHVGGAMLMIGAGVVWMRLMDRLAGALTPPGAREAVEGGGEAAEAARPPAPFGRRVAYFLKGLRSFAGWSFALRVGLSLAVAEAAATIWPDQHLHWIAMTIVLLSARRPEPGSGRIRDRALGTAFGVAIAGLMLLWRPTPWELVAGVALIAGARPFLRARSYMAYSVAMTPLIMLLQDFTTPPRIGLLADRLGATLAGAALVMILAKVFPPPPAPAQSPRRRATARQEAMQRES